LSQSKEWDLGGAPQALLGRRDLASAEGWHALRTYSGRAYYEIFVETGHYRQ
jgi:hypothetical protein